MPYEDRERARKGICRVRPLSSSSGTTLLGRSSAIKPLHMSDTGTDLMTALPRNLWTLEASDVVRPLLLVSISSPTLDSLFAPRHLPATIRAHHPVSPLSLETHIAESACPFGNPTASDGVLSRMSRIFRPLSTSRRRIHED